MESRQQLKLIGTAAGKSFAEVLEAAGLFPLRSRKVEILQMNITRRCNLSCGHCHVEAGPDRTEEMSGDVLEKCLSVAHHPDVTTVDITGGAPETHPRLVWLLHELHKLKKRIIVRSNLVILLDPLYAPFIRTFAENGVELVASVPAPDELRSDRQRGTGSFQRMLEALRALNDTGYGIDGSGLQLHFVHNPAGAFLAAAQDTLQAEYKRQFLEKYGIRFTSLFCLNNCPVGRFLEFLVRSDNLEEYMDDLIKGFNREAAENVMCRSTLSVGWDGTLYDCDFNQMLQIPVADDVPSHVSGFSMELSARRKVMLDNHCFACTAGAGSSCQGATTG